MGSEYWITTMVEKFKDCVNYTLNPDVLTNNTAIDNAKELLRELDIEMNMNYMIKMLKSSINSLVAKVDDVLPPEARTELVKSSVHVAKRYFVPGAALLLILILFRYRSGGRGGANVKMMRAPGRNNIKISRTSFEKNPRGYFRNLRG